MEFAELEAKVEAFEKLEILPSFGRKHLKFGRRHNSRSIRL
jgi:hypothetical protein